MQAETKHVHLSNFEGIKLVAVGLHSREHSIEAHPFYDTINHSSCQIARSTDED